MRLARLDRVNSKTVPLFCPRSTTDVAATDPVLNWSDLDRKAVDTARVLAMDAVEMAGNGHPGTAMSLAPAAYMLFNRVMRHDPTDPEWAGRDRFVLSCGHSSLTLYVQLFLSGYGLAIDDLKALRQWESLTPGHPEYGHTPGVEVTTGPLGQGIGNAVGMAMSARRQRGLLDPDTAAGESPFDHFVYSIASDGDIEEGVSHESSAIASVQKLGNLVVIYDDNEISIEDDTRIAKNEDVGARYEAYGWHVQTVNWRGSDPYVEDVEELWNAIQAAKAVTDKPSFIVLKTIIGYPAPKKRNTGKIHGSALGAAEVTATKELLGFHDRPFAIDDEVVKYTQQAVERGRAAHTEWQAAFDAWAAGNAEGKALFDRLATRTLPVNWHKALPEFPADPKGLATRAASGKILEALAPVLPELWGGSADLAESNNTTMKGEPSFIPAEYSTKEFPGHEYGRTLHFGIREHGMGSILNGIAVHGGTRPYGGTFLVFSDYMRGSVRLSALMKLPVIFVWTHDSIGIGEDGPTHQPIETVTALRAIVGLDVVRPADANETAYAWRGALEHTDRPTALALTRQNVPTIDRSKYASAEGTLKGGYILAEASSGHPEVILIASGSEVAIALTARERLEAQGTPARVVSMPCQEWFFKQDLSYQHHVLPHGVRARVSVEAGIRMSWDRLIGDAGEAVSIEHYGASAPASVLFEQFGFTADNVVAKAHASLAKVGKIHGQKTGN
ncbi:transketolase [Actinoplanes hulinensis]|uniref:Transketolase n=1 Tax=Actinoplanes hulinensis TaxID=1144547 RepID=A0ABS7AZL7_9ACTN|nr:transketolase [Actinoplanes hulinensis]MBW6433999.1 transketolase [Actinoplanes hulinensis]